MIAPLVRTEDGAIHGVDWRRTEMSHVTVPGLVLADEVMPGDTVILGGDDVLVLMTRKHGTPDHIYVITRSEGGAEIVHELRKTERVEVVSVGAFDRSADA